MKIISFFICLLKDDCPYSIKKFLTFIFTGLVLYLAIFTDRDLYDFLAFIAVLLGIRSYERMKNKTPKYRSGVISNIDK